MTLFEAAVLWPLFGAMCFFAAIIFGLAALTFGDECLQKYRQYKRRRLRMLDHDAHVRQYKHQLILRFNARMFLRREFGPK